MTIDLQRLVELDRLLSRRNGVTEIAKRLAVSRKTAYRDPAVCRRLYGRRLRVDVRRRGE